MKVQPSSLLCFFLCLGLVFVALCNFVFAGSPVPEKIPSLKEREVRVFLKTQTFGFYEKGNLVFGGQVCTGKKGCETPKGNFKILMKAKNYYSKKYDGAAMPFSLQFTTGGHFLHVGEIRPKPSSHGCVRLSEKDAKRIFGLAKIGDAVIIE